MPQTIEDLGRAVKAKYPTAYDDVPDAELGRRVQAKYPGAYDDFTAVPPAPQPSDGLPHPDVVAQQTQQNAQILAQQLAPPPPRPPDTGQTISAAPRPWYSRITEPFVGEGSAFGTAMAKKRGEKWAQDENPFDKPLIDISAAHLEDAAPSLKQSIPGGVLIPDTVARGVARGAQSAAAGLTTPKNAELIAATFGSAGIPLVSRLLSGYFTFDQLKGAYQASPKLREQIKNGDQEGAIQTATEMGLNVGMAAASATHA